VMFSAAAIVAIGAFFYVAGSTATPATVAASIGLVAWWLGLSLVRAMLARSVSLHMLRAASGGPSADFDQSIASRLDEARKYRLVTANGNYQLAPLGRVVSRVARLGYAATRTRQ